MGRLSTLLIFLKVLYTFTPSLDILKDCFTKKDIYTKEEISRIKSEVFEVSDEIEFEKVLSFTLDDFEKELTEFNVPLSPYGTAFQKEVWKLLSTIPFGQTKTYKSQADQFNSPDAIRAIASANGKNPLAIIIPCHRVLGSDGSLTGYAGGLWRKKWLLEHEGSLNTGQVSLF